MNFIYAITLILDSLFRNSLVNAGVAAEYEREGEADAAAHLTRTRVQVPFIRSFTHKAANIRPHSRADIGLKRLGDVVLLQLVNVFNRQRHAV